MSKALVNKEFLNTPNAIDMAYTPAGTGAIDTTIQAKLRESISVKDFGATGDGVTDDTVAIQAAINYAAQVVIGEAGKVVYFPNGTYLISSRLTLPNRVGLQGANGRGTVLKPHSSFTDSYMLHAVNGTNSMFASWVRDFYIDARNKNMTAVVWSQAWQESCGMERVLIYFNGTTPTGFLYTDGYGGAAYLPLRDIEIFSDSTAATVRGIWVQQVSLVGGFVLSVDGATIAGSATNTVDVGIAMTNDSLVAKGYHAENCVYMCVMNGAGSLSADTWTGSANPVTDMVAITSTFTGKLNLRNMIPNGSTGNILTDNKTSRDIPVSVGMLAEYIYQPSSFSAYVPAQILNVTGNGTEYTVIFGTEVYDYLDEYNNATGIFTAQRTGKYLFTTCIEITTATPVTTFVLKLATSNRTYHLFRGDTDSLRDGSAQITFNGAIVADMDAGDTARINIIATGLGTDTIDVEANESFFQGQWLAR